MRIPVLVCLFVAAPTVALAQGVADADVLPKWAGGLLIQPAVGYGPGQLQRFGNGWQFSRESLIADVNGLDLAQVITGSEADAQQLESLFGTLGVTSFEGDQTAFGVNFLLAFGLTERLTIVGLIPYQHVRFTLDAALVGNPTSTLRVKNSEALDCPGGQFNLANDFNEIVEDGGPGYRFNIGDLNRALISKCLNYKPVIDRTERRSDGIHGLGDRSFSGFRDLIFGAKYQFYRGRDFQLAALGYIVAPTGTQDDPDDLFDVRLGDGQWDAALLAAITYPFDRFRFTAASGYEISFADTFTTRLSGLSFPEELEDQLARGEISERELYRKHIDKANLIPVVTRFDKVDVQRKLGDTVYVYSTFSYQILEWLSVGVSLNWLHHFRDKVTSVGPRPEGAEPYKSEQQIRDEVDALIVEGDILEENRLAELKARFAESDERKRAAYGWRTVRGNLVGGFGLNFQFLTMFLRGEFPIPLIANISMSRHIAGQNIDTPDAVNLTLVIPFLVGDVRDPSEYGYDGEVGGGLPWP